MDRPKAIFKNPANADQLITVLSRYYSPKSIQRMGNDIVIGERKKFSWKPLKVGFEYELIDSNFENIADLIDRTFTPFLNESYRNSFLKMGESAKVIYGGLGNQTSISKTLTEILINPQDRKERLKNDLFPILIKEFKVTRFVPITVDYQGMLEIQALGKFYLVSKTANFEQAKIQIVDKQVYSGIQLRDGLEVLGFVECYLQFLPYLMTLSYIPNFTSWHFHGESVMKFDQILGRSMMNTFQSDSNLLVESSGFNHFKSEIDFKKFIWDSLNHGAECVNRLINFALDYCNFCDESLEIDYMSQMKFVGAMRLLYADIQASNKTSNQHIRTLLTYTALGKIANICFQMTGKNIKDEKILDFLLASQTKDLIKNIFVKHVKSKTVLDELNEIADVLYDGLHNKLRENFVDPTEKERLQNFRVFRNYFTHGTSLRNDIFADVFSKGTGLVPFELTTFPYLFLNALSLSPSEFFDMVAENFRAK